MHCSTHPRIKTMSFIVDRECAIRYQLVGEANWAVQAITTAIERLID